MHPDGRGRHRRALRQVLQAGRPRRELRLLPRRRDRGRREHEAEAESKYLAGVGVARQRKAIVDGLKNSISDFTSNEQIKGASSKDVVDLLLITQYFDMLNSIGTRPDTLTVFIDEDGE